MEAVQKIEDRTEEIIEIQNRLKMQIKAYHAKLPMIKSRNKSNNSRTRVTLYKTLKGAS